MSDILKVLHELNDLQESGIVANYALGGAVAATFFIEPTATLDVDVFIQIGESANTSIIDPSPIFAFLKNRGHDIEGEYVMIAGWPVQFLGPPGALGDEGLANAAIENVGGTPARTLGPEYLAAICLQTGRPKDKIRLLQFLNEGALDREKLLDIILRHNLSDKWVAFTKEFLSHE